jgi:hypothetical protein
MFSSRNVTIPRGGYFKDVKQPGVATMVLIKHGSIVSDNVASYGQSVQHNTMQVMHSAWSASILDDVNEIKQGATTKSDLVENRQHCEEQTLVARTVSPCKDHGRYASVRDADKDLIQSGISPKYAAQKGDSFCEIAEKRLHKPHEKIHHEKKKKLVGCIFVSSKQREEVNFAANESNEEVPIDGLNLLVKKDENTNNVAVQKGQRWSVFQSECKIKDKVYKPVIPFVKLLRKGCTSHKNRSTMRRRRNLQDVYLFLLNNVKKSILLLMNQMRKFL